MADSSVTTAKINDSAVTTSKIADLNVTNAKLAADAITTDKIKDGEVQTSDIKDANVTTIKIADSNITNAKLAADAVTTAKILDETIIVDDLANNAIETAKIKDLNVTTTKLADAAVTTTKIASGGNNKVLVTDNTGAVAWIDGTAFGAVADQNSIEGLGTDTNKFKVKDLGIITAKLADGAVTNDKIGETILVAKGGTGATTLTGYVKGNGTNAMTAVTTIPVAEVTGAQTTANLSSNIVTNTGSTTMYPSVAAVESYVATNATVDATTSVKGKIKLAGDLAGTADLPTVPGLANKENTITAGTTAQYWRGDKTWQTLDKAKVGLSDVDNTSDASKPISSATQAALDDKAPKASPALTGTPTAPTATAGDNTSQIATTEFVTTAVSAATIADATASTKGKIQLAGDITGTAAAPVVAVGAITTAKILDGTIATIDVADAAITSAKIANGTIVNADLADNSVTNTKLAETILVPKGGTGATTLTGYVKGNGTSAMTASNTIPVGDVVDAQTTTNLSSNMVTNTGSTSMYPSVAAVETFVANNATVDATTSLLGKIRLNGDLAGTGSTANAPIITDAAINTSKLANNAVTSAKITDATIVTADLADGVITNSKLAETITVANGGTGTTTLSGYVKGNGTSAMTAVTAIPVADVTGAQTVANVSSNITTDTGSSTKYPSVAAVESYVANKTTPDATTTSFGKIQLAGDLGGVAGLPLVLKLRTVPVSPTVPTTGQLLQFDGTAWTPITIGSVVRMETEEISPTVGQTTFSMSNTPIGKVAFFINGVRVPKAAIAVSGTTITYTPSNNGGYTILSTDRIAFDYIY
jgi:hypothetical protein